ncbi:threonine ammonia-lyase, biosynthetic [Polynucleobacter paneuropaeus]|uniref:L-threonine dehydratase n=1 Tax=Polynucleobacter paneuropaeus TaxID=2527775 RepID=A0A9Q2WIP2_9BURK|nr:threonine ammonia-lyase, biosynthetic [Polynucleobacter paneuropaeus]QWD38709.1 threonine ammonia-lyase, biosynthetic [Polynucleobacter paneuropaeus]
MATNYLKKILAARVYDVARETELELAPELSKRLGNQVLLKREDNQPVFSFKLRGAYNKMAHLSPATLKRGVIAASAGNHAQGVALAAAKMKTKAVIVMPVTTPSLKIDAVKARGGSWVEVILHGESYSDAFTYSQVLEKKRGLTFVHPFDDPDVIAGQGTIAMEIFQQHEKPIDAIFVAIGGGGLIAGIGEYVKAVSPKTQVIGVQSVDSDAMKRSLKANRRIEMKDVGLFSDGTAVKLVGKETFRICKKVVDEIITVDTDEICAAINDVFTDTRSILEPAGALAIAGLKKYVEQHHSKKKTLVAVACGANMNFSRLRFVAERADVGEFKEAVFAVTIPEERGSFKRFCELLGKRNVTEFNYRIADQRQAHIFVGIGTQKAGDSEAIAKHFRKAKFATIDLTHDELAKSHLRHMVGGHSALAQDEQLYRFEFPERPGALMKFLTSMAPNWNISLFHYRNHGADYGRILVGIQVPKNEQKKFQAFVAKLGYPHWNETNNPAYRLFLK